MSEQPFALIIESDEEIAHCLAVRITAAGLCVAITSSTDDASELASSLLPQLVIIDMESVARSDCPVAGLIRSCALRSDTVVIVISNGRMTKQQAHQLGANYWIQKPRVAAGLLKVISAVKLRSVDFSKSLNNTLEQIHANTERVVNAIQKLESSTTRRGLSSSAILHGVRPHILKGGNGCEKVRQS